MARRKNSSDLSISPRRSTALAKKPRSLAAQAGKNVLAALGAVIQYQPSALSRPTVDPDFGSAGVPGRVIEAIRYHISLFDYAIEPNGWLRAWLVLFIRLLLFVAIPTVCIMAIVWLSVPVMAGAASVGESFARLTQSLESAFGSLARALCWAIVAVILFAILLTLLPILLRRKPIDNKAKFVKSRTIE